MLYFLTAILLIIIIGFITYFTFRFVKKRNLKKSLELGLYLIEIPIKNIKKEGDQKDFKTEINLTEQLLSNLSSIKEPFIFEIAVPHVGEEIHFYLAISKKYSEVASKQIQSLWPGANFTRIYDDYTIFNPNGVTIGAYLTLSKNFSLPIRTYNEIGLDTFNSITGGFSKINEIGEGSALQLIIRPADSKFKKTILNNLKLLKQGNQIEKIFNTNPLSISLSDFQEALNPKSAEEKQQKEKIIDEDAVKALELKLSKPLFEVNLRVLTSAPTLFTANDILDGILGGFNQFSAPRRNEFKIIKPKKADKLIYDFTFRNFNDSQKMILNSEEIASFFHLPISSTDTPKIKWLKSKQAPPPPNLPTTGTLIGQSLFRGETKPVYITDADRMRHIYIIGQTGTGKSTLLANMFIEDMKSGKGLAVIDPHGDLVENALSFVPKERIDDVIYFDPGNLDRPLGLNMLEYNFEKPEEKTFIVNELLNIFDKLYNLKETGGPMFEQYMRNATLLLMEDMPNEPATLIEIPRIFTDEDYRERKLLRINNPVVIDFWEKEAIKAGGEASLSNITPYITSKFNTFIANDYMRPIIGQVKSAFNFRQVMDEGKILLVNLSKGRIGDINASLLGMIFTGKILMAALSRVDTPQEQRKDFNLYIDEFQNFTTDSISTILSEARKYKLSLTIAHQFIAQLTEKIRDSIFGNVGSQIVFRVGVQDAEFLVKQFEPIFDMNDLTNIDNLNAYVKLLINGQTSKPFNIQILKTSWSTGNAEQIKKIKEYCFLKYGMDKNTVEDEIVRRLRE
jgi:hypothetical protein